MMKISEIAKRNGINERDFIQFCNKTPGIIVRGGFSPSLDDADAHKAVSMYDKVCRERINAILGRMETDQVSQEREKEPAETRPTIEQGADVVLSCPYTDTIERIIHETIQKDLSKAIEKLNKEGKRVLSISSGPTVKSSYGRQYINYILRERIQ